MKGVLSLRLLITLLLLVAFSQTIHADLVSLSNKVGKKIDVFERDKYTLFEKEDNYWYAVFIQLKEGSYTLNIVYTDGTSKTRMLEDNEYFAFKKYVEDFDETKAQLAHLNQPEQKKEGFLFSLLFFLSSTVMIGPTFVL